MVKIKCPKCNIIWNYTGDNPSLATHSRCMSRLSINKHKVLENAAD